jgi:three-Cys-motif partner protein
MSETSQIGEWSQAKLEIVRDYGREYSKILNNQPNLSHAYIDAFAGPGTHALKTSGEFVPGSPLNALSVSPPFAANYFIDINGQKVEALRQEVGGRPNVYIYQGDCNDLLLNEVYPRVRYEDYWRALCLLDPYGLHLDWQVIEEAGRMKSVEIFLNFPMLDINRNALAVDPSQAKPEHVARMTRFWGDESWREIVYRSDKFFNLEYKARASSSALAAAFRERLKDIAGFNYVPEPVVMRTLGTRGPILYYLFFASRNPVAEKIVRYLFDKYRARDQEMLF